MPSVPTNGSRRIPRGYGPRVIAGRYATAQDQYIRPLSLADREFPWFSVIPEETEIFVSPYPLHHDPRYFSPEPESFLPERWLKSPSSVSPHFRQLGPYIHNTSAFIPFSYGPHNCVGRQLAYRQLRYVVCLMMRRFEVQFAHGFCPRDWIEKACDRLVLSTDPLPVVLAPLPRQSRVNGGM
jgi:hypothetical protein